MLIELTRLTPEKHVSRLRLVKYCFLLAQAWRNPSPASTYSFVPYKYGPFSFTLYRELDALIKNGELSEYGYKKVVLPPEKKLPALSVGSLKMAKWLVDTYGHMPTSNLLSLVYERYPWYTLNCRFAAKRSVKLPQVPCFIYTAGYEGEQVESFLNRLLISGIQRIIDVRANPISRKYGFHKSTLSKIAGLLNMDYRHIPELGIPSAWRTCLESARDYAILFSRYNAEILPHQSGAIDHLAELVREKPSVLVCQEADPEHCHRWHLAKHLKQRTNIPLREIGTENYG